ncbi:hypothetical protein D5281_03445 [bacterium 1xD42-62]|uniref:Uncharacterized protein n=1 Tax=Parablautia muri TaxID=2320879 RepID=A0A9X5BDB9_9FIRM|nr:hypothetical protein [Parablautia muri]
MTSFPDQLLFDMLQICKFINQFIITTKELRVKCQSLSRLFPVTVQLLFTGQSINSLEKINIPKGTLGKTARIYACVLR